jgi:signal transduction histidine kinase
LLIGFGGLLVLLALTGLNALSVLKTIETRNGAIREDYLNRNGILQQLRSSLYLSGTYARDFLMDPDQRQADLHRKELEQEQDRIKEMTASYAGIVRPEARASFDRFNAEVNSYFESLAPVLLWTAAERKQFGYEFMQKSLLPRRMVVVQLADEISRLNQEQLEEGNQQITSLFSRFRQTILLFLAGALGLGVLLAAASIARVLRLEKVSAERFEEVLRARRALSELSARLLHVQETERRALSRELHDEVGQAVSGLLLAVGNVAATLSPETIGASREQLQEIRRVAEKTVAVVRDMSLLLRPSMLDDLGLIPALQWQAREVSRTHDIRVTVEADPLADDMPEELKTCIFRVVQEALRNVTRHARATSAQIKLTRNDNHIRLLVQDDGHGFLPQREKGLGLLGMEERVKHLNGRLRVESQPGSGTIVQADLPATPEYSEEPSAVSF